MGKGERSHAKGAKRVYNHCTQKARNDTEMPPRIGSYLHVSFLNH